jgi:ribosomal protein S12 methylthiotransferase accessory factor
MKIVKSLRESINGGRQCERRDSMRPIQLTACPKVYILETHRSRTPDDTLRFVERIRDTVEMRSFRNATDVDRLGIQVFTCDRIRPDGSMTSHTGKGVSPIQAQVSITMEAIERYCSEFRDEYRDDLVRGSYRGLVSRFNLVDPWELILSRYSDYDHHREINWTWGYDLSRNENILVPACAVYHPYHEDDVLLMSTHTNGIAAGNTMEEAVIHGLAEVIERDAWSITRYATLYNDAIFIEDDRDHDFIIGILEKFAQAGIEIVAKDLTTDVGIPVIGAFSRDLLHPEMVPVDGFGAHMDPRVAAVRALLEIATTRALLIQKYGIDGMCTAAPLYLREGEDEDPRFYAHDQKGLRELNGGYSDDINEDVKTMIAKLRARGLNRVIAVDLTRTDIGIPTVRVIVPGMETYCFDQSRVGGRAISALED